MTSCRPELCLVSQKSQRTSASDINILKRLTPNGVQNTLETKDVSKYLSKELPSNLQDARCHSEQELQL